MRPLTDPEKFMAIYAGVWIFTKLVTAFDPPGENASYWAKGLYRFAHELAGVSANYLNKIPTPTIFQLPAQTNPAVQTTETIQPKEHL